MKVSEMPLVDIYEAVRNGLMKRLEDATATGEVLAVVQEVIYGEQQRIGSIRSPALWVVPESWQPELKGGFTAEHAIKFNVVSLVKSANPQEGLKQAERVVLRAYDVLIEGRTLDGLVADVRPLQVDPAHEAGNNTQLSYAAVQFALVFKRRE